MALEQPTWLELGSLRPRLAPDLSAAGLAFPAPEFRRAGRKREEFASRLPEIGHGCSLGFEEPQRIHEPRQFHRSDGNGTAGRDDLRWRGIECSLKVADPVDRSVERAQLMRQAPRRGVPSWKFDYRRLPFGLDDASRNATIALLLCSLMTARENATLGGFRHGSCGANAGRRCRLLKPVGVLLLPLRVSSAALCLASAHAVRISRASGFVSRGHRSLPDQVPSETEMRALILAMAPRPSLGDIGARGPGLAQRGGDRAWGGATD